LKTYLLAFGIIFFLMVAWNFIQFAWRKIFSGIEADADVLAARGDCHGCDHKEFCHDGADNYLETQFRTRENNTRELENLR